MDSSEKWYAVKEFAFELAVSPEYGDPVDQSEGHSGVPVSVLVDKTAAPVLFVSDFRKREAEIPSRAHDVDRRAACGSPVSVKGEAMAFAVGKLDTLARNMEHSEAMTYAELGSETIRPRRGWLIDLDGLDKGFFAVFDGTIHRAGGECLAGSGGGTPVSISAEIADLSASATQAIFDAVAKWEAEERKKPCT